jgi:hypothetical protein
VDLQGPLSIDPGFLVVANKIHHIRATYRAEVLLVATVRGYSVKAPAMILNNVAGPRIYKVII